MTDLGETHFIDEVSPTVNIAEPIDSDAADEYCVRLQSILATGLHGQRGEQIRPGFHRPESDSSPLELLLEVAAHQHDDGGPAFVEQTPGNLYHAASVLREAPDVRVILIVRDPRSVVYSNCHRWKAAARWASGSTSAKVEVVRSWSQGHPLLQAVLWRRGARAGLALEKQFPREVARIRYEELISEPEITLRRACSTIGVQFERQMLDVDVQGSSSASNEADSTGFKARSSVAAEDKLSDGANWLVERLCATEMKELDYSPTGRGAVWQAIVQALSIPKVLPGVAITASRLASVDRVRSRLAPAESDAQA